MSSPQPDGLAAEAASVDRRVRNRVSVDCACELVLLSSRLAARIVDISTSGARLQMPEPPLAPSMAMLRWNNNEVYCTVVWANERQCGVAFERGLAGEIVAETILDHGETTQEVVAEVGQIAYGAKRARPGR